MKNHKRKSHLPHSILRSFGVNSSYLCYLDTIRAMQLIWEDENRMTGIKAKVYQQIARETDRTPEAVGAAIQRCSKAAWHNGSQLLLKYDGLLVTEPSNSAFLEILLCGLKDPEEHARKSKEVDAEELRRK